METNFENFGAAHAIHSFITTAIIAQVAMMYLRMQQQSAH